MVQAPIVETAAGRIRGRVEPCEGPARRWLATADEASVAVFRGVPFAAPPVGALRFAPPAAPIPWSGVRDAVEFGAAPPQSSDLLLDRLGLFPDVAQSEDCLTLNVWTPFRTAAGDGARRPVLVWIHGGAFSSGAGSLPLYDARRLALRGDVVAVTLNYRVGALGFLHLADAGFAGSTNLGLLDQIAALRFVRAHADRFGGDPGNVTVFGESAGAGSIVALLSMPEARGLFRRAIVSSAAPNGMIDAATAAARAARFVAKLGVAPERLRDVPVDALLDAQQALAVEGPWKLDMPFVPVVDGAVLPRFPVAAIADGSGREVELVIGTTDDEMRLYAYFEAPDSIGEREALRRIALELPGRGDAERLYAAFREIRAARGAPHAPADLLWAIQTEVRLRHHSLAIADARAAQGARTFVYRFGWQSPDANGWLGACHALDLPFTFGNLDAPGVAAFAGAGAAAEALSRDWMDAWCAFARSGDPSHAGIGTWPAYDLARRATLHFGAARALLEAPGAEECRALGGADWAAAP